MDNTADRLTKCFLAVFPGLSPEQIRSLSAENVEDWDSVAQVNLLSVINEEFGIDVDFEEFEGATSFPAILERLEQRGANA